MPRYLHHYHTTPNGMHWSKFVWEEDRLFFNRDTAKQVRYALRKRTRHGQ